MDRRKGQEEIVGFVLIMIIVAVVFLVFLGISLNKGSSSVSESKDIYQFLESSMEFTSDCEAKFEGDFLNIGELFEDCHDGGNCLDGRNSCEVLERLVENLFESSWNIQNESFVQSYNFESSYVYNDQTEEIISFESGNCTGSVKGASYLSPAFPGKIESVLEICF